MHCSSHPRLISAVHAVLPPLHSVVCLGGFELPRFKHTPLWLRTTFSSAILTMKLESFSNIFTEGKGSPIF